MAGSRKLGRSSDHRRAMLRGMVTYLLENGRIETTVTRAKEVRAMAEKMITLGKNNNLHSKRQAFAYITKESVVKKLFDEISPKYADVNGGLRARPRGLRPRASAKGTRPFGIPSQVYQKGSVVCCAYGRPLLINLQWESKGVRPLGRGLGTESPRSCP